MRKFAISLLLAVAGLSAFAQSKVTGKIVSESGESLAGVAVFVKGSNTATTSDLDGNYSIMAKDGASLVFNCLGYEEAEVPVAKRAVINVTLRESVESLESVVVTGYQTISKERATGSFDIVDKAQIEKPASNIASRLIGAAPGLSYTTDVYGNPTFQIRGVSTFAASAPPLIVIDGFPVESDFESINPNDVENITVLKDAAAASIWGAKSANGVIVITTKNAKASPTDKPVVNVEYSGFYKISPKLDLDYTLSQASVDDIIDFEVNHFNDQWASGAQHITSSTTTIYERSKVQELLLRAEGGYITQAEAMNQINQYRNYNNYDQIRKYLLDNASTLQQSLDINIGTKRTQTAISLLYQDDDTVYAGDGSTKYNLGLRNKTSLFKWLDLNINATYNYKKTDNSGYGLEGFIGSYAVNDFSGLSPYEMILDSNGDYVRYSGHMNPLFVEENLNLNDFPYSDWTWNPLEEMRNRELITTNSLARIQGGLTFKIIKGLTIDAKFQYEMINSYTHNYYGEGTYYVRDMVNYYSTWDQETGEVTPNLPTGGILDQSSYKRDVKTSRLQANFNREFAQKHQVTALAGVEFTDNVYQSFSYPSTYGYNDETLSVGIFPNGPGGTAGTIKDVTGTSISFDYVNGFNYTTDRYFSAFANAAYTYDGKYSVSGSIRTDASNLITDDPSYRYAPFWSVGASWQIGKENFMKNVSWVDALALRATYGHNGNVDKSTTFKPLIAIYPIPSPITGETFLGHEGSVQKPMDSYGNPTLRWERTKTFDIGIDYDLFKGKLHGKFDVYNKHSIDLIANVTVPYATGTNAVALNNGEISNKGFELEIGSTIPISKDIVWDGTVMLSYNKNKVLHLEQKPSSAYQLVYYKNYRPKDASYASYAWMEGYDMNTLWTYKYAGLVNVGTDSNPVMEPAILGKDGTTQTFGGWPTGDAENISYNMGTTVAPVNASFSTSLKVYDFDISMIFSGKFGHKFLRESFNYPEVDGKTILNSKYSEVLNCDPDEMIPLPETGAESATYSTWYMFYPYMSYLVADASLIRCQEINVTYNLPKAATKWLGVGALKVFVQANNPFNIYFNKWNEDPEFKRGSIRLQSTYMVGVKCSF